MTKTEAQAWYEAYKLLEEKKRQEQQDFYSAAVKLASQSRMTFRECKAWADWCEALPREEQKPQPQRQLSMLDFMGGSSR